MLLDKSAPYGRFHWALQHILGRLHFLLITQTFSLLSFSFHTMISKKLK